MSQHTFSLSYEEAKNLSVSAAKVLKPRTPITTKELFAGRWTELTTVADAAGQPGLHVVIYGERGVGKTSLANVVRPTIQAFDNREGKEASERIVIMANANGGDGFASIWEKLFGEITWEDNKPLVGFHPKGPRNRLVLRQAFDLPDVLSVDDVRKMLSHLPGSVFIIDEFDRAVKKTARDFTDLIKALSDFSVDCTVILVGVSDTIDHIVADHASINRALIHVMLPRMKNKELEEILANAEKSLKVQFSDEAKRLIVRMSQGLPHYTHLIGLNALRKAALQRFTKMITKVDVFEGLKEAVKQVEQTVTEQHSKAVHSAHKEALFHHVLVACAITAATSHDALGYFNPAAVVNPLELILGKTVEIATFNNHLAEFCQEKRGPVLERLGQPRAYRYRFRDPLLVPFVFMSALSEDVLSDEQLSDMLSD